METATAANRLKFQQLENQIKSTEALMADLRTLLDRKDQQINAVRGLQSPVSPCDFLWESLFRVLRVPLAGWVWCGDTCRGYAIVIPPCLWLNQRLVRVYLPGTSSFLMHLSSSCPCADAIEDVDV